MNTTKKTMNRAAREAGAEVPWRCRCLRVRAHRTHGSFLCCPGSAVSLYEAPAQPHDRQSRRRLARFPPGLTQVSLNHFPVGNACDGRSDRSSRMPVMVKQHQRRHPRSPSGRSASRRRAGHVLPDRRYREHSRWQPLARVKYPGELLTPEAASLAPAEAREASRDGSDFLPVTFQIPVAVAVVRVAADFSLQALARSTLPSSARRDGPQVLLGVASTAPSW